MDRRMFAAFGLIFLILIGSQMLMQKLYPKPDDPTAADSTATHVVEPEAIGTEHDLNIGELEQETTNDPNAAPTAADGRTDATSGQAPVTRESAAGLVAGPAESTVQVTTPLYRLSISSIGGRVIRWETFEHKSWTGDPVQLVPEKIPAAGPDALLFRHGEIELGDAHFRFADAGDVNLGEGSGPRSVTLTARTEGGMEIRKIFTFHPENYGYDVDYVLEATDPLRADESLDLLGSLQDIRFGWNQGVHPTERVQKMEGPSLRAIARVGDEFFKKKRDSLKKGVENASGQWRGSLQYAGLQTRYFTVMGIVPLNADGTPKEGTIRIGGDAELFTQSWNIDVPAVRDAGTDLGTARLQFFVGPQDTHLLAAYGRGLEDSMDLGWKWIRPLSVIVLKGMEWMHRFIPNYGLIIIIFSVLTKLAFYPLTRTSTQSMKKMQELQPKMKALQEKYKGDKEKLNQATMELYRTEGVNPLAGCLPILVQSPVFIALYQALSHTISLRGQPFVLWMKDLSAPDALTTLPFALPFLGSDVNVLPILMAVAMYFQTKLTPNTGGGQMAMMNTMMPLFMVFIFYNMPSGLVLYWLVNTIMQAYQSWRIHQTATPSGGNQTA